MRAAQSAGARAVLVVNNDQCGYIQMGSTVQDPGNDIVIPSALLPYTAGLLIQVRYPYVTTALRLRRVNNTGASPQICMSAPFR